MKRIRLFSLVLALALLLAGCSGEFTNVLEGLAENLLTPQDANTQLKFSQMEYVRPDVVAYEQLLDNACQLGETSTDPEQVMEGVYALYDAFDSFYTMYNLADLRYAMDLTDTFYEEEYLYCSDQSAYVDSTIETLYAALARSPILDTLETEDYFGPGFFDAYEAPAGSDADWEYESVWDDTLLNLSDREAELEGQYYSAQQELSELDPDSEDYRRKELETLGPILVDLIRVRQETAAYLGYDSTETCLTDWYYGRTVSPEEVSAYAREIQTHLVPLYVESQKNMDWDGIYGTTAGEDTCLRYVSSAAQNMGGVFLDAYTEMIGRELYDISPSPNKAAGSFEIYLVTFDAPFILVNPWQDLTDVMAVTHEFGHFVNDYAICGTYASSDVSEVMSQTMEYLSLEYSEALTSREMKQLTRYAMTCSLAVYVEQMAYYTFEQQAYRLTGEELTVENLCALYEQVARDFGFEAAEWRETEWVTVPHFFQYPFYVYSYVVSNDAAMQIYQMELEQPGTGLELYRELVYEWEDLPLSDYLAAYELQDPLSGGRVAALAELYKDRLGLE